MDANTPAGRSAAGGESIQDIPPRPDPTHAAAPSRPEGPNAAAVVLGVVSVVLAGLIIAHETMTWQVDWSGLGPGAIVVIGAVLVLIGGVGLVRRHDKG